jgi:hypothetical protein
MFNDLRARRFRHNDCDIAATLDELAAAAGFRDEVARTGELGSRGDTLTGRAAHRALARNASDARRR